MTIRIHKPWFRSPVVIYDCPFCGSSLRSPVAEIGIEDRCPKCDGEFVVPGEAEYEAYLETANSPVEELTADVSAETIRQAVRVTGTETAGADIQVEDRKPTEPIRKSVEVPLAKKVDAAIRIEDRKQEEPKVPFSYDPMQPLSQGFDFDREVDKRLAYYRRFPYFSTLLIDDPNIVLGVPSDICPYCGKESKKATCKHCGQKSRSRSSVQDYNVWVKIREEWVQTIDEQRAIGIGELVHKEYLEGVRLRAAIKDVSAASVDVIDVENRSNFLALERERREYATRWQWGLYRNATVEQGMLLDKAKTQEGFSRAALMKFMEVCYLDLNGANNSDPAYAKDREMLQISPPWNKALADAHLSFCISDRMGDMSKDDVKRLFLEVAERVQREVGCPVKPSTAWNKLVKAMREDGNW
ncbi:hypothetical protein GC170_19755 [bacterium]|nr:hypothetical protein [bacterium]